MYIEPNWPAPLAIKAYTTLRTPTTHPAYGEQSLREKIPAINSRLQKLFSLPEEPIWLTQKHTVTAIEALPENKYQMADASFTDQPNRVCIVFTADCLPLLICTKQATHVAAIHAGWRGLANGIIEATLQALQQSPDELLVWLGPAIGPKKFEVGQDVYDAFIEKHAESVQAFQPLTAGKWLADIYTLAKIRLKLQGISQIYGGEYCTYTQADLFHSYRREQGKTGRMASMIWIEPDVQGCKQK